MIILVLGIIIGIVIGWNWTQPPQVKAFQERILSFIRSSNH